ncbi:MAG: hypothetical protein WD059_01400 [Balneolaceae bacterium]
MQRNITILYLIFLFLFSSSLMAQSLGLDEFENYVIESKNAGVTHVNISEDIPPAFWKFKTPGDPYPAWFLTHPVIVEIFPPDILKPYINQDHSKKTRELFIARSKILRKHDLKAYYSTDEPHVLPEVFYKDYPLLRGPRVDQVNRSRTAQFAPCTDRPEVLQMYRESVKKMLELIPELEIFSFQTTDSGAGFCWTDGLYPGKNGPSWCQHRPMADRVQDFMKAFKEGAAEAGREIKVEIHGISTRQWMIPTFENPEHIAEGLPKGYSVEGLEGPDASAIQRRHLGDMYAFAPIIGVFNPVGGINNMMADTIESNSPLIATFPKQPELDLEFNLYRKFRQNKPVNKVEMMEVLRSYASDLAGPKLADDLLELWFAVDKTEQHLNGLNFGPIFRQGTVLTRWINRPLVPFPEELTTQEKEYYRPYLLQAKGEEQANDLADIQAMHMFEGYGAKMLVQRLTELATGSIQEAIEASERLISGATDGHSVRQWELLNKRLKVVLSFIRTVDNVVGYQALLDLAKQDSVEVEPDPVLGALGSWKRQELIRIARNEVDNAAILRDLLVNTNEMLIHTARTPDMESIRVLSPQLTDQLKRKIEIMNNKWQDYNRLFTRPNP